MLYFWEFVEKGITRYVVPFLLTCLYILSLFISFRFDIPRYSHVQHTELAICNKLMYVDYY